jgi:hypothetical protein
MMLNKLRLRYGLFWPSRYPDLRRHLFGLFVILLLVLLAGSMDYYMGKAQELERLRPIKQSYMNVVLAAMNGDARFQVGDELFECKGGKL